MNAFFTLLLVVGVIAAMVLLYLKVLPQKLDGTFGNKLLQFLHDYFNFKKLYVEFVLKFIFMLLTVFCIVGGVVGLIASVFGFFGGMVEAIEYGSWYFEYVIRAFFIGSLSSLGVLVLGPVVVRLAYEFTMMFVLLVKNVMEINNKTKGEPPEAEPVAVPAEQEPCQAPADPADE